MTWGHEAWGESKLKGIGFSLDVFFLIHLLSLVEHVGRLKTWMVDALCFELSILSVVGQGPARCFVNGWGLLALCPPL